MAAAGMDALCRQRLFLSHSSGVSNIGELPFMDAFPLGLIENVSMPNLPDGFL
jgi:hypothetical protein